MDLELKDWKFSSIMLHFLVHAMIFWVKLVERGTKSRDKKVLGQRDKSYPFYQWYVH